MRGPWFLILAVVAVALAALTSACGDDDEGGGDAATSPAVAEGDEAEIDATLEALADAWNEQDVDGYLALVTDDYIAQISDGATRAEAAEQLPEFIGDPPYTIRSNSNIEVSGDTATAEQEAEEGVVVTKYDLGLVREEGQWKLDSQEELLVDIPEGVTAIDVELTEFTFNFDDSQIEDGNIAFAANNTGQQDHELVIVRVGPDFSPETLAEAFTQQEEGAESPAPEEGSPTEGAAEGEEEELPPGVEEFVSFRAFGPGESANVVYTQELESGEYAMVCCFPDTADPEEAPHCGKGMVSEFTIP